MTNKFLNLNMTPKSDDIENFHLGRNRLLIIFYQIHKFLRYLKYFFLGGVDICVCNAILAVLKLGLEGMILPLHFKLNTMNVAKTHLPFQMGKK